MSSKGIQKLNSKYQNIKIIFVTYTQQFASQLIAAFDDIVNNYAAVHILQQYSGQQFEKKYKNHPLTKRSIIFVVLNKYQESQINHYVEISQNYDQWYHYGQNPTRQQLKGKVYNIYFNEVKNSKNQILAQIKKNLQLDFSWVGAACRLGCELSQFVSTLTKKQNFQTTKTQFMMIFFQILDRKLSQQNYEVPQKKILDILDECKKQSEKQLESIQQVIQQLVCKRFNVRTIVSGITEHRYLKLLKSRNYFKIIWIQQSTINRFNNFQQVIQKSQLENVRKWLNLENFLMLDDYWYVSFVQRVQKSAQFTINNTKGESWNQIIQKNYSNIIRQFRPTFDQYFLSICQVLKTRAGCIKQAVGSIIVRNKRIISTGYNGTPIGTINCFHGGCRICDNSEKMNTIVLSCNCIHAEYSCIIEAGIQATPDSTLYTTRLPCLWCAKVIIQARIKTLVYLQTEYPPLSYTNQKKVLQMFKEAKIQLKEYKKDEFKFSQ